MSTFEPVYAVVTGRLVSEESIRDDLSFGLTWKLEVNGGPTTAGPAGVAQLRPTGSELVALFDYAEPGRLLGVEVPFGSVDLSEDEGIGGAAASARTMMSSLDAGVVEALLGGETARLLHSGRELNTNVRSTEAWAILGRVAVLQTHLEDAFAPLDGLWAAEVAAGVWRLAQSVRALEPWAAELAARAQPTLQLLDTAFAAAVDESDPGRLELERALLACERTGNHDVGPLATEMRATRAVQIEERVAAIFEPEARPSTPGLRYRRSGLLERDREPEAWAPSLSVFDDGSLRGLLLDAHAVATGSSVRVEVALRSEAVALGGRIATTVSTRDGELLASAFAMRALDDDGVRRAVELLLPPGVQPDELLIVVGRRLEVTGVSQFELARRRAEIATRRGIDAVRRQTVGGDPDSGSVGELEEAQLWWTRCDASRVALLQRLPKQTPFLSERLRQHRSVLIPAEAGPSLVALAGLRSLQWSLGETPSAAATEAQRLRDGGESELDDTSLETLALAARFDGDVESAVILEAEAVSLLSDEPQSAS